MDNRCKELCITECSYCDRNWNQSINKNFLQETISKIHDYNKTIYEVLWIGNGTNKTTWEQFSQLANFQYDNGFGENYINLDLIICGKDWWMERHEYDGSEWWEFKEYPKIPHNNQFTINDILIHDYLSENKKDINKKELSFYIRNDKELNNEKM